jgi:hypothetical protein
VFVGLSDGWTAGTRTAPTADDIAENLDAVEPFTIPGSIFDEVTRVCSQLGIGEQVGPTS